jgi:hypothetical protein
VQEKNQLIKELKSVKLHYQKYEPAIQTLQRKYQAALKEKMMVSLDRDRLREGNAALKQQLQEALVAHEAPQDTIKGAPFIKPLVPKHLSFQHCPVKRLYVHVI